LGWANSNLGQDTKQVASKYGQIAADDQSNKWQHDADNLMYGTGQIGRDGKPDLGFFGLKGADALRARLTAFRASAA
jgi:hypothetical protein